MLRRSLIAITLAAACAAAFPGEILAQARPKAAIVSFGLWGSQSVFASESSKAAALLAARFNGTGRVITRANSRSGAPANAASLNAAVQAAARRIDPASDVLIVFLTSHGTPQGIGVQGGRAEGIMSPAEVGAILDNSGVTHRVLIVSACYSGVFTSLSSSSTLVITAASSRRASFGCKDGNVWTYFGEAFFAQALRRTNDLREAYDTAVEIVAAREARERFPASNPQFSGGRAVLARLRAQ